MNENNENKTEMKTQVDNVIILDRSGSMSQRRRAAVEGFNETLASVKVAQEKYADTQDHYVTLVTFCDCETKHVYDMTPVAQANELKMEEYVPCCCTPLYDAMGYTLTQMRKHVQDIEDATVVVTVITDGMENASREYNGYAIKTLVEELRGEGWTFTYMGANQDAVEVARNMSIRNSMNFDYSDGGTREMMRKDSRTRMNFYDRLSHYKQNVKADGDAPMSKEDLMHLYTKMADDAFDEEQEDEIF